MPGRAEIGPDVAASSAPQLEVEEDAERWLRPVRRKLRKGARLDDGAQGGLIVERVAGAPLDPGSRDAPVPIDLDPDERLLLGLARALLTLPALLHLGQNLPQVPGVGKVGDVDGERADPGRRSGGLAERRRGLRLRCRLAHRPRAAVARRGLWRAGVSVTRRRADPKGEPIGKPWATLTALTTSARAR